MSLQNKLGIEDWFGWLENSERSWNKQKILASRWGLKQQFKYGEDAAIFNTVVDSLTENELEWLARDIPEGYSDCQRRSDFFEQKASSIGTAKGAKRCQ